MQKGRIAITFIVVSLLLLSGITLVLTLRNSTQAEAAHLRLRISKRLIPTPTRIVINTRTITISRPTIERSASTPTPTPTPIQSEPTPTSIPNQSVSDYILEQVNNYKKSQGLSQASSNSETCSFAATRAQEIAHDFNHDGFRNRINSNALPYPSYHEVTENIAQNSNYKDVINQWINSPGHAENMRKDTPFVCIGKYGDFYAYEGWRP